MILRAIIKVFIWSLPRTKLVTSSRYLHIIWRNEYFDIQMCRSNRFHFLDILSLYFYISNHVSIILKRLPNYIIRNIFISLNTFIVFDSSIKWKKEQSLYCFDVRQNILQIIENFILRFCLPFICYFFVTWGLTSFYNTHIQHRNQKCANILFELAMIFINSLYAFLSDYFKETFLRFLVQP